MVKRIQIAAGLCAIFLSTSLSTMNAHATGTIACDATDGSGAAIMIGVGRLPILAVISAFATAEGQDWSLDGSVGTDIDVGQGFMDDERVLVDFVDPNFEEILISLRLFRSATGKSSAEAGVLTIHDVGSYAVMCEEG
ncbi:MAG: hypothetical protein AAGF25_11435 [Pseudomonadota bacterium]